MSPQVGDKGFDWSFSSFSAAQIKAAGGKFGFKYLSGGGSSKDWTAAEIQDFLSNGLGVGAYWETSATRMLSGQAAGVADAQTAVREAAALGYTGAVWFADDENDDRTTGAKLAYCQGVASVMSNWEVYGSAGLIDAVAQAFGKTHGGHVSTWGPDTGNCGFRQEANVHTLGGTDDLTLLKIDCNIQGYGSGSTTGEEDMNAQEMELVMAALKLAPNADPNLDRFTWLSHQLDALKTEVDAIKAKLGA